MEVDIIISCALFMMVYLIIVISALGGALLIELWRERCAVPSEMGVPSRLIMSPVLERRREIRNGGGRF